MKDLLIVGSGVCGLASAALLSQTHHVRVLEAGPRPGGVAAITELDGLRFCAGPQYLWGFGPQGPGTRILAKMGLSVPMTKMAADFDQLQIGDGPMRPMREGMCEGLLEQVFSQFPEQAVAVAAFCELLDQIGRTCEAISDNARFMNSGPAMLGYLVRSRTPGAALLVRVHGESLGSMALKMGVNPTALRALTAHQSIFGESNAELSLVLFAAARHHLKADRWIPDGGTAALISGLVTRVQEQAHLCLQHRALALRRENGRWHLLAQTPNGNVELQADAVILACPPSVSAELLPDLTLRYQPSYGVTALCLSVAGPPKLMRALANKNLNWFADAESDVDFSIPAQTLQALNLTAPSLNGSPIAENAVLVAFYPHGEEPHDMAQQAIARIREMMGEHGHFEVLAQEIIDGPAWSQDFGAPSGAIYGRRLSVDSMLTPAIQGLPKHVYVAHSGAGISGVMGCLEMAERAAQALLPASQRQPNASPQRAT
ncbi:MAG: phytoene dehydrogenase-like protein [Cognaticolwellia sp.]|jgi:phytoene dehydrogenase-like protein